MSFKVLQGDAGSYEAFRLTRSMSQCSRVWDPINAGFETCSLPFISAIPAVVTFCILLSTALSLISRRYWQSKWLKMFAEEPIEWKRQVDFHSQKSFYLPTPLLFVVSAIGLLLQAASVFYPHPRIYMIFPTVSWAAACLYILIYRLSTASKSLLIVYITIFVSEAIVLADGISAFQTVDITLVLVVFTAIIAILKVLNMPFRDANRASDKISPLFGQPTAELRSPEDNLTPWQFMTISWLRPLISLGSLRQLNDEDVWSLSYEFQHRNLHDQFRELHGTVIRRLLEANGLDLLIMSILSVLELLANLSSPVLLQKILQSMENPRAPKKAALTYAALSFLLRLIATQSSVFSLWYGRRAYERSRGEMITMLYEKTLSRKVVSLSTKSRAEEGPAAIPNGNSKTPSVSIWSNAVNFPLKLFRRSKRTPQASTETDELATTGKILNLMRFDAYEVAQRFWEFPSLVQQPLNLIFCVVLVWKLIGWPCLAGVVTIFVAQGVNALIARMLLRWERKRRIATDTKLQKISQLVESIRHLRWYGWQDVWFARIMEARQHELHLRIIASIWSSLINFTNTFASGMFPVVAFYAYTALAGQPLRIDVAFPALQLFTMLEMSLRTLPSLITVLLNARISVGRIEDFMNEPNKDETDLNAPSASELRMECASFAWPGASESVLYDITLSFPSGLTVIYGEVGAGKTALLQALLGEMDQRGGEYHRTNDMVGYCAQTPWLQSMSVRENILFSAPYEEDRYKKVLEACALIPDMANFKHGDLSLIGENGIGLSGGQKARVALARSIYSRANVLFLDDPLSALDHQTAESIVRKCLDGPLLKGRTTILVTHRTELCFGLAKQLVEVANGRSRVIEPGTADSKSLQKTKSRESTNEESSKLDEEQQHAAVPDKFIEDEHRAHGGVVASVYWEYIKAGKLRWWFVLVCFLTFFRVVDIGRTWFLKQWGEAYDESITQLLSIPFDRLPSPENDITPWLLGFFFFAVAQAFTYFFVQCIALVIVYNAGKQMFRDVMEKVTHAKFRFYDITPVGRLMNRLTSDINTIDGNISAQFQVVAILSLIWISSLVVIGSVTPMFLVFAIILTSGFVFIFFHYLPTSQSLRRLEMVSLTPLISNFGTLADGLTTIRAFCAQYRFQQRVITVTDIFQKHDHFYWSLQTWLVYRFDILSAASTFILTALALFTSVSPGLTAFVLSASSRFIVATHGLCRQYGQLQMNFVSVERVVELLHLDQESPGSIMPPAYWPRLGGNIVFEDVAITYAPNLDPALSNITLTIEGGSTTALIGRTGSGKSTLALSLLATTLPVTGRILIDGIDISTVDKQALRNRVTFLAQEPVLFPGTMRANLDPLDEYSDTDCATVLEKIAPRHSWTLDMHIDTGGKNLSQGQRQLVGLARALLRRSSIIVMDEATASIDMETAMKIQKILREEMTESTVVTIAHRVEAVKDADFCVVLEKGRVKEMGKPGRLVSSINE